MCINTRCIRVILIIQEVNTHQRSSEIFVRLSRSKGARRQREEAEVQLWGDQAAVGDSEVD